MQEARRHGNVTTRVIEGFHSMIKGIIGDFVHISKIIHDPDMGFTPILRAEVVDSDFAVQKDGRSDWVAVIWSRDMLRPCAEQGRQFQGVKTMVGKVPEAILHRVRYVDLTINNIFATPTMDTTEFLEETFLCYFPSGPFEFHIDRAPDVKLIASVKSFEVTGVSRLSYDNYGSLSILSTTAVIAYPLVLEKGREKLIMVTSLQTKV